MGWDAFGLPTENYAIKNKIHPEVVTKNNVAHFKPQRSHTPFTTSSLANPTLQEVHQLMGISVL